MIWLWLCWSSILLWQIVLLCFGVASVLMNRLARDDAKPLEKSYLLFWISLGAWLLMPLGWMIRNQMYKRHWQQDAVTISGYCAGNSIFFALLCPVSLLSMLAIYESQQLACGVPLLFAILALLSTSPNGKPLQPHEPRLGDIKG